MCLLSIKSYGATIFVVLLGRKKKKKSILLLQNCWHLIIFSVFGCSSSSNYRNDQNTKRKRKYVQFCQFSSHSFFKFFSPPWDNGSQNFIITLRFVSNCEVLEFCTAFIFYLSFRGMVRQQLSIYPSHLSK